MPARIQWTARRFEFCVPVDVYPELIERLRGTPARVEERLRALPPEILTRRPGEAWSIQEHAGHLGDTEEIFLGRLDDYDAGVPVLRAADMTNRKTFEARHNERPLAAVLADLRRERARLLARLEGLVPEAFARTAQHPRLDVPMRLADMLFFHAEHDDYHLARITELARLFAASR